MKLSGTLIKILSSQMIKESWANGVAHNIGQALCYYVSPSSGCLIACSTIQSLLNDEWQLPEIQQAIRDLNLTMNNRIDTIDNNLGFPPKLEDIKDNYYLPYVPTEPEAEQKKIDSYSSEALDNVISAEVLFPKGDILIPAKVISREHDPDGILIGARPHNPILDTCIYNVEFPDGHVQSYSANIIVKIIVK